MAAEVFKVLEDLLDLPLLAQEAISSSQEDKMESGAGTITGHLFQCILSLQEAMVVAERLDELSEDDQRLVLGEWGRQNMFSETPMILIMTDPQATKFALGEMAEVLKRMEMSINAGINR